MASATSYLAYFYVKGGKLEILQYPKVTVQAKGVGRSAKGTLALQNSSNRPSLLKLKSPYRYVKSSYVKDYMEAAKLFISGKKPL